MGAEGLFRRVRGEASVDLPALSFLSARIELRMRTVLLLIGSNIFMTFAWYGHLKYKEVALWKVILVSWSIAFFEYCLQVPANRIGARTFSPDQLKVMQEVVTLTVFGVFSVFTLATACTGSFCGVRVPDRRGLLYVSHILS